MCGSERQWDLHEVVGPPTEVFPTNRMRGSDDNLVRVSETYESLERVAEEWYCDAVCHTSKRSWMLEKAVYSLFLTYVFGSAVSQAVRKFNGIEFNCIRGGCEYARWLMAKLRLIAQRPDESMMVVRSVAGFPNDLIRRLTVWERPNPVRHRFQHFVVKLHELEALEIMTKTVNTAAVDKRRKTGVQGSRRPNKPHPNNRNPYHGFRRTPEWRRNARQPVERKLNGRPTKWKELSRGVACIWGKWKD